MKKILAILCVIALLFAFTACGAKQEQPAAPEKESDAAPAADGTAPAESAAEEQAEEPEEPEEPAEPEQPAEPALPDGEYQCAFNTDSGMFHVNETCDGMGTLTVKDGKMTPREAKILEDYKHYSYYVQKMRQNRTPYRELRAKINAYRHMIRKQEEKQE